MHQLDAIQLSQRVQERLTNFVTDDSFVRDPQLTAICKRIWGGTPDSGGLISDLWVEGAFPAMSADKSQGGRTTSLDDLVQSGDFNAKLRDQLNQPDAVLGDLPLYLHQRDAILRAQLPTEVGGRPAFVVTAGTGAGKTESFLLPMLNDLYSTTPQERSGVECIILYPMNALVNDQVDRLYRWLQGQGSVPVCTLFHMTSETPEDYSSLLNKKDNDRDICRMWTRKQARGLESSDGHKITLEHRTAPPRILITNYSMLEYMLCRPQDAPLRLLQLGAVARESVSKYPLVPHRLHLLVRTTAGLSVCLNPDCSGDSDRKLDKLGCVLEGIREHCPYCQSSALTLVRCDHCGEWAIGGSSDGNTIRPSFELWADGKMPRSEADDKKPSIEIYSLKETPSTRICVDTDGTIRGQGIQIWKIENCMNCQEEKWVPFFTYDPYTLSTLTESIIAELPHFPSYNNEWLPARGRRLLAFSDSRQEAARLGPRLTLSHELQLFRSVMARQLIKNIPDAELIRDIEDEIKDEQAKLKNTDLSDVLSNLRSIWTDLLTLLCDDLRSDGCVTLGSDKEDQEYEYGEYLVGNWCSLDKANPFTKLQLFVGATDRQYRRTFMKQVLEKCGLSSEDTTNTAKLVLELAYHQLCASAGWDHAKNEQSSGSLMWLERDNRELPRDVGGMTTAIRIRLMYLALRNPIHLYESGRTYQIWTRQVLGCAPEPGCTDLKEITREQASASPRYGRLRGELLTSPIFEQGLWAVEHSAQLNPKENRRLQDLFKVGARNILSSTTTLELGIDIGGLNAVLMGNVPPGKANYLQRAGRAGRRADGSSVVVTFVRSRPFDREVFRHFGRYLGRALRRPTISLERARIGRRHFHAWLLNEFFRVIYPPYTHVGAMRAFGNMGQFCGVVLPPKWEGAQKPQLPPFESDWSKPTEALWWNDQPETPGLDQQFMAYLDWLKSSNPQVEETASQLFSDTGFYSKMESWNQLLDETKAKFQASVEQWVEDYASLLEAWKEISSANDEQKKANAIRYQLRTMSEITVIEALADRQFLPRYGFPIGVLKLKIIVPDDQRPGRVREEDQFRLERPGLLALREYVPGSQLLVGGKLITSKGVMKHWTGAVTDDAFGLMGSYTNCQSSNPHLYYAQNVKLGNCPICNAPSGGTQGKLLFPRHGFMSAASEPPKRSTDVERIGSAKEATITFHENGLLREPYKRKVAEVEGLNAYYAEAGEILVFNTGEKQNGFAICTQCGYAESERESTKGKELSASFQKHTPLRIANKKTQCWKNVRHEPPVLRNQMLAARETTDVLMLDISEKFGFSHHALDDYLMRTLARSLQAAGAKLLGLDEREIGVMVVPTGEGGKYWGPTLYDNVPGGAGHVLEMLNLGQEWLREARRLMYVDETHHKQCATACLECLLNFSSQFDSAKLKRRDTVKLLDSLLSDIPVTEEEPLMVEPSTTHTAQSTTHLDKRKQSRQSRGFS